MTPSRRPRRSPEEQPIPKETEFLVDDIADFLNQRYMEYLRDARVSVDVKGYSPFHPTDDINNRAVSTLPLGITLLKGELAPLAPGLGDFVSMDLRFMFPITEAFQKGLGVTVHFSDGSEYMLEFTSQGPVETFSNPDEIVKAEIIDKNAADAVLRSLDLPPAMKGDSFENLLVELNNIQSIVFERRYMDTLDDATNINIVHSARYGRTVSGQKGVVQDLTIEHDHFPPGKVHPGLILLPKQRSMLRFGRDEEEDKKGWLYRGTYIAPIIGSDISGILVNGPQKLVVPSVKLLDKTLEFLTTTATKPARPLRGVSRHLKTLL
jgi:hypothetical protein